ncbi:unnamed protein product, partial [Phaeothamnion confervicola]
GADTIYGGGGNDTVVCFVGPGTENESKVGAADHISDFATGDKIDVSAIDAIDNAANGNSAFTFSANASTQAGTCRVENHADGQRVFLNINGGAADMDF